MLGKIQKAKRDRDLRRACNDTRPFADLPPADRQSRLIEVRLIAEVAEKLLKNPRISEDERKRLTAHRHFLLHSADVIAGEIQRGSGNGA